VPALLPFLVAAHGWSYGTAAALVLAGTLSSSVIQPLFGLWSDRRSQSWLMPVGVLAGTVGVGLAAVAPSFGLAFAAVVLGGLGVAAFHPEGQRYANYLSGARRATGMSFFSLGGNTGFALGPILVTPAVALLGLEGALLLILPGALVAILVALELPRLHSFHPDRRPQRDQEPARPDDWPAFGRLGVVIVARTFAFFGLLTFIPLYFVDVLGTSEETGNTALTVFLVGGAVGTLIGGQLADRVGRRPVVVGALALCTPIVLLFASIDAPGAMPLLFLAGASVVGSFSVTVVLGQEYLPNRIGVASGFTSGLAIGLGGFGAAVIGLFADAHGLDATMVLVALLPLLGVAAGLTLPRDRRPSVAPA
jgi:FSR family fosmidomycin resistance protein-like MFS transporter